MPSDTPLFLFAHGAGAGSQSDWMTAWADRLATLGRVLRFDYPYMAAGKKRPDRLPVLMAAHREALQKARSGHPGPVFLAGKSMGGRVACHLAGDDSLDVEGVICFGFPLRTLAKVPKERREVLLALTKPVLFVQGDRDRMSPLDVLADVRGAMSAPSALHVVPTGDHSLRWTKTALKAEGIDQVAADERAFAAVRAWVQARLASA